MHIGRSPHSEWIRYAGRAWAHPELSNTPPPARHIWACGREQESRYRTQKLKSKYSIMHFSCIFMHFPCIFIVFVDIFPISKIVGAPQGPEGGPESTIFEIGKISTKIMKMHGKCMKIHEKCMILYFDFNFWVRYGTAQT